MSEAEIFEITDSSIIGDSSTIQENIKRKLSIDDEKLESDTKKFCLDDENEKLNETSSSSIIIEPTLEDSKTVEDEEEEETDLNTNLETNKVEDCNISNESEVLLEEIQNSTAIENTVIENEEPAKPDMDNHEEEELVDKSDDHENEDLYASENSGENEDDMEDDDEEIEDDDVLMMRAMSALKNVKKDKFESNNEPIALDDSDSDIDEEEERAGENQMTIDDDDDDDEEDDDEPEEEEEDYGGEEEESDIEEYEEDNKQKYSKDSLRMRIISYNPRFYLARVLLKKSMKILNKRQLKKKNRIEEQKSLETEDLQRKVDEVEEVDKENITDKSKLPNENESIEVNKMDISSDNNQVKSNEIDVKKDEPNCSKQIVEEKKKSQELENNECNEKSSAAKESKEIVNEKESANVLKEESVKENNISQHNDAQEETESNHPPSLLLNEIENFSVEEIMNRYILQNNAEQTPSSSVKLDEFTEELFYCLQQNKLEIQKAQQIWNEKVHIKFKIREIMERIRRHRAVNEIENFGFKPSQESQNSNVLISSKSSTTNSENEPYERSSKLTSESVNRLIQDVRTNVLKKEKKNDEFSSLNVNDSFDECSMNSHMQSFQSASNQGRQGQIIDVQSIINDFRQKNPQEIPRRGRRMKNSFENSFMMDNQMQSQFNKNDKSCSTIKSNSPSGFPEVSLLPVNNFYKNHSNTATSPFGQKSSLLQSILTKQTTKSPIGYNSSTLARLLTAPERSFQNAQRQANVSGHTTKVHNNGEITITPIAGTSKRQDFTMDDEENSTEPPLVIDESDDFDMSERTRELLCQGCRRNKALFMCAGCSRQWYCSKECQELAWNDHENSCF